MPDRKLHFNGKTLEEVADKMSSCEPGSPMDQTSRAEFLLRQSKFIERQTIAVEKTAKHTKKYTRYMFWSVLILALSAAGTFFIAVYK